MKKLMITHDTIIHPANKIDKCPYCLAIMKEYEKEFKKKKVVFTARKKKIRSKLAES